MEVMEAMEKQKAKESKGNHTIRISNENYAMLSKIPSLYKQDVLNFALKEYFKIHKDKLDELIAILKDLGSL